MTGRRGGRHRGRLFWRVWLNGLLLLAAAHLALAAVAWATSGGAFPSRPERVARLAARLLERDLGDPARLAATLAQVREGFGVLATVYRGGQVVASSAEPPLPSLPAAEEARLADGPVHLGRHQGFAAALDGGAYLVVSGWRPLGLARGVAYVGAVLLALALASIPLARAIAAPLERLTAAARRLGSGDLSARAGPAGPGEVGELARAFDDMAARLERQVRAERELLANVSHELRTPLARIRVALELAAAGDWAASRRYLAEIGTDVGELEQLVEDVLAAARLASGQPGELPLRRERVAGAALVERAAERFRRAWPARRLEVAVEGTLPELEADPVLLRRALDGLLDNARKYSDEQEPVRLVASADGSALLVEVRDRGIGIEASDLPRLFTPFFRTDRSRARGTGGVGLGLALARRIAEAHGGTLSAESVPGRGSTFRLRVPAGP